MVVPRAVPEYEGYVVDMALGGHGTWHSEGVGRHWGPGHDCILRLHGMALTCGDGHR